MSKIDLALLDIGSLDTLARRHSSIHRLDPRAKVLTAFAFIAVVVSYGRYDLSALIPLFAYPILLVALGNLPAKYLVGKILLASPFAIAIGILNPLIDRAALVQIGPIHISGGWISFVSILLRFVLTLSAALILISTTGFNAICLALERLRVPRVLVVQLLLLYRYIFVLTEEAARVIRAHAIRSGPGRTITFAVFVSLIGQLLLRSLDRAQRIHTAMLSRGFDGEVRLIRPLHISARDVVFTLVWVGFFAVARICNIPQFLGAHFIRMMP